MKKHFTIILFVLICLPMLAQVPPGFNYQAVIRNGNGEIITDKAVSFRLSLLQDSEHGATVYSETHSTVTNGNGLVNIQVGMGTILSGSFSPAGWGATPHFIKVEIDPENGSAYTHMGTMQLMAVPYAFHAHTVEVDQVDDADNDPFNEIQVISLDGLVLSLSMGGGEVMLPEAGGDNWGTQSVATGSSLQGDGTSENPLEIADGAISGQKIAQNGAIEGQVLKWNGTTWEPANDETGTEDSSPTGPAGGDLTGSYPDPGIADNTISSQKILDGSIESVDLANNAVTTDKIASDAVTSDKILDGTISSSDLANNAVTAGKIANNAVTGAKIAQSDATEGQVLKWNGSTWVPANDETGDAGGNPVGPAGGDLSGFYPNPFIADNAITSGKIAEGAIMTPDIANNAISTDKIANSAISTNKIENSAITTDKIANTAITSDKIANNAITGLKIMDGTIHTQDLSNATVTEEKIADGAITGIKIAQAGASDGQVLKWNGSTWEPANDNADLEIPYKKVVALTQPIFDLEATGTNVTIRAKNKFVTSITGETESDAAIGIYGLASSTTGVVSGVMGATSSTTGRGITGWASSTSGTNHGVYGRTNSSSGYAVYGIAESTSGTTYGVYGQTMSPGGTAIWGRNLTNSPGSFPVAIRGDVTNANGYSGVFNGGRFYVNGDVGIGTIAPSQKLHVVGNALKTVGGTTWAVPSDIRLKVLTGTYARGLKEVSALQPVKFRYREDNAKGFPSDTEQVGFVAQEVQKIFPEAVDEGQDGYLELNMHAINIALVNAVKELSAEIERLKSENEQLRFDNNTARVDVDTLNDRMERLEKMLFESAAK